MGCLKNYVQKSNLIALQHPNPQDGQRHIVSAGQEVAKLEIGELLTGGLLQYLRQPKSKNHHQFTGTFEYYGLNRIADREFTEVRWA